MQADVASPSALTTEDFEYYLINSSLYFSKIEGNSLDVNSFFRSRGNKNSPRQKALQAIEDLIQAYRLAVENPLNLRNFLKTQAMLAKTFLPAKERGNIRKVQVGVRDAQTLRPVYLAVEPEFTG